MTVNFIFLMADRKCQHSVEASLCFLCFWLTGFENGLPDSSLTLFTLQNRTSRAHVKKRF
jgi:hypothetical protein